MTEPRFRPAPVRLGLLALALGAALALPASASAGTIAVAPPELGPSGDYSAAATGERDPGCRSRNAIEFREGARGRYRVRHVGRMVCGLPTRIACRAVLSHRGETIAADSGVGRDRCAMGSSFAESARYDAGEPFKDYFRYRIKLRNERQRWAGTSEYCPERRNRRRVLVCYDSFRTAAPNRAVVRHN